MLNETPLQDAAHALLLQKLVDDSIFFAWILHESEDGTKHMFTLLVVEMVLSGGSYIFPIDSPFLLQIFK